MFTGIIEARGVIEALQRQGNDMTVTVASDELSLADVKPGDSIATNGVCLTVTRLGARWFCADVSGETLRCTTFGELTIGSRVNLEKAMLASTRFGGHMVSGHVDGVATVRAKNPLGKAWEYWLQVDECISRYITEKGSVTVDGISLTVNEVNQDQFKLTIVPHTSGQTTIDQFVVGTVVNIEVDIIARYVERLISARQPVSQDPSGVTMALLAESGFIR